MENANANENENESVHIPVLVHEVVEGLLAPATDSHPVYLDGTLGGAGHAKALAAALKGKLTIIGLDRDPKAIDRDRETLKGKAEKIILENEDYRHLDKVVDTVLDKNGITRLDLILLDLGISSDELDNSGR